MNTVKLGDAMILSFFITIVFLFISMLLIVAFLISPPFTAAGVILFSSLTALFYKAETA